MDLNILFADQVRSLQQSYRELGHAPDRLQVALQAAIDGEVERTNNEVQDAKRSIEEVEKRSLAYRSILDDKSTDSVCRSTSSNLYDNLKESRTELERLQTIYASRKAQAEKLLARIDEYRTILGDQVPTFDLDAPNTEHAVVTLPRPSELHAVLSSCAEEVSRRNTELEETLSSVVRWWSDLWIRPDSKDAFDTMILHHLKVRPVLVDVGEGHLEFAGNFEPLDDSNDLEATPTRKSGSEKELGTQMSRVQQLKAIAPTLENIAKASNKVRALEDEKERRFHRIQQLFDELSVLWKRFEVGEEAIDDFVQENTGFTLAVVQSYERELKQMKELKAEHMTLFISKVREDIAALWDQLLMTEAERSDSLPEFFEDLSEGEEGAGLEPSDELLTLHEQKCKELAEELAVKAKPLELVRQYHKLLDEAQELEASAKDISRLTGRGTGQRRDPGRLLREEKMRKRIKVLKPKIEEELMRAIPTWEQESGRAFCIDGVRFLDTVDIQPASPRKRVRTVSNNASAAATPQVPPNKRARTESVQSASVSVRRVISTPFVSANTPAPAPSSVQSSNAPRFGFQKTMPKPAALAPRSQNACDTNRVTSHSSNGSVSSHATDRTTIIHKPAKLKRRGPSLLLEESLRQGGLKRSEYANPGRTGAGACVRPIGLHKMASDVAGHVSGPNWAVLDEDEENTLLS